MAHPRVIERAVGDVVHPFGREPYVDTGYQTTIDLFPAYPHDAALVARMLGRVDRIVGNRVMCKPAVYVLHHDTDARTNGWAMTKAIYPKPEEGKPPWAGIVVLPAKRIPIHPAMTRYVVAHEYGHHVEFELLRRLGKADHDRAIAEEYAELRGTDPSVPYGGGNWHRTTGELFANDFRIIVCEVEPEFWPHPGFAHPSRCAAVKRWWRKRL